MRRNPYEVWIEQREAAQGIREAFGLEKAIGYLIGEKLLNFLREADRDQTWAAEVPAFTEAIKEIFTREEIAAYLGGVRRVGALGHVASDEAYEEMREEGAVDENPVEWARQILVVERMKRLLLP